MASFLDKSTDLLDLDMFIVFLSFNIIPFKMSTNNPSRKLVVLESSVRSSQDKQACPGLV